MFDVKNTIISQYANSPILLNMIRTMDCAIDPMADLHRFYETIWNLETAQSYGLDVWGAIVGIGRHIHLVAEDENIGFSAGFTPFNQGAWHSEDNTQANRTLDDETYRRVIMLKAMSNIIYAAAPSINQLLRAMFGQRGRAYFVKNGTMAARYVFEFYLLPIERAIIRQTDLLPRPCGVLLDFYEPETDSLFGYREADLAPFGQGAFFKGA